MCTRPLRLRLLRSPSFGPNLLMYFGRLLIDCWYSFGTLLFPICFFEILKKLRRQILLDSANTLLIIIIAPNGQRQKVSAVAPKYNESPK